MAVPSDSRKEMIRHYSLGLSFLVGGWRKKAGTLGVRGVQAGLSNVEKRDNK